MKTIILYIILIFASLIVFPQNNETAKQKENFEEGEFFFNRREYEEAVIYYLKVLNDQPQNASINFKIGESYLNIPGKEALAVPYLEKAVSNITEKNKYKKNSFAETKAPLHAYFYLGNAYRYNNQLDMALDAYKTFVNSPWYAGNYNITIVENEIKSCERAKIIEDNPILFEETVLSEKINTSAYEFFPVVSGNEKSMVFVRRLKFYDAIFYSQWNGSEWENPVNINPQIGSDGEFYPSSLSYNGDELFLIRNLDDNKDIYVSRLVNGEWKKAEKLSKNINTLSNEDHASVSANGKILYFSSDKAGGHGGFDIYMSELEGDDWGKPKNLGKVINTEFDETAPFVMNDNNMLFFCSKGHYNMGGYDIFYSVFEEKQWKLPINIGFPVNNTADNNFFQPIKGNSGYFSRKTEGGEDIYKIIIKSYIPEY